MSAEADRICALLRETLAGRTVPGLPEDLAADEAFSDLLQELTELRRLIMAIAKGDLSSKTSLKGYTAGALKTLQANLRHMTWQTQQIAAGDFSQRLDFLGEFSSAFNSMAARLESSLRIIREKEEELGRINAGLKRQIGRRKQAQAALAESEAHYRNLADTMTDMVWILDSETLRFTYVSPSIRRMLGYSPEEIVGRRLSDTLTPRDFEPISQRIERNRRRFLSGEMPPDEYQRSEVEQVRKDGGTVWAEAISRYVMNEATGVIEIHGVTRDISERRALRLELERQAATDSLTDIANRRHFLAVLQKELDRCGRHRRPLCLLMLDIDHFKTVNDTYGHAAGDRALQAVARICRDQLRSSDLVGRIGGEEFAMTLVETDLGEACSVAERLLEKIEGIELLSDQGGRICLTASIGVAQYLSGKDNLSELMLRADKALYKAKGRGRNRLECYE